MPSSTLLTPILPLLCLCLLLCLCHLPQFQSSELSDLLRGHGLPAGLFPREVKSFTLEAANGRLEVNLFTPCLTKFENRVYFDSVIRGNLSYGGLTGLEGLSQEELFLWLPIRDIIVDDPSSGLILFDVGVVHKQFSVSLFEDPPDCKPVNNVLRSRSGVSGEEEGLEAL